MRSVAVGLFALILSTGLFVSQVGAKNDKNDDQGKNKYQYNYQDKNKYQYNHQDKNKYQYNHKGTGSVPIPGTLLLFGGGFAGLVVWRTKQL